MQFSQIEFYAYSNSKHKTDCNLDAEVELEVAEMSLASCAAASGKEKIHLNP